MSHLGVFSQVQDTQGGRKKDIGKPDLDLKQTATKGQLHVAAATTLRTNESRADKQSEKCPLLFSIQGVLLYSEI